MAHGAQHALPPSQDKKGKAVFPAGAYKPVIRFQRFGFMLFLGGNIAADFPLGLHRPEKVVQICLPEGKGQSLRVNPVRRRRLPRAFGRFRFRVQLIQQHIIT